MKDKNMLLYLHLFIFIKLKEQNKMSESPFVSLFPPIFKNISSLIEQ